MFFSSCLFQTFLRLFILYKQRTCLRIIMFAIVGSSLIGKITIFRSPKTGPSLSNNIPLSSHIRRGSSNIEHDNTDIFWLECVWFFSCFSSHTLLFHLHWRTKRPTNANGSFLHSIANNGISKSHIKTTLHLDNVTDIVGIYNSLVYSQNKLHYYWLTAVANANSNSSSI